jgi:hypothetical protein
MLALGLILVIIASLALIAALTGGSNDAATFDLGLFDVQTNTMGVFLIGAATVLLFVSGLELVRSGLRRANRRRKEKKEYRRLSERYDDDRAGTSAGPSTGGETAATAPGAPVTPAAGDSAHDTPATGTPTDTREQDRPAPPPS